MDTWCGEFLQEFQRHKFSFNYPYEVVFYSSQLWIPHYLYVVLRFLLFGYTLFGLIYFAVYHGAIMMKFFTIWSYIVLVFHFGLAACISLLPYRHYSRSLSFRDKSNNQVSVVDKKDNRIDANSSTDNTQPRLVEWRRSSHTDKEYPPEKGAGKQNCELVEVRHASSIEETTAGAVATKAAANSNNSKTTTASTTGEEANQNNNNMTVDNIKCPRCGIGKLCHCTDTGVDRYKTWIAEPQRGVTFSTSLAISISDARAFAISPSLIVHHSSLFTQPNLSIFGGMYVNIPWYCQLSWLLTTLASLAAPIVTVIYFSTIYPTSEDAGHIGLQDINIHILNLVFVVVDQIISARPVRILHFYVTVVFGICYVIFSVVYWSQDPVNNVIYAILDWRYPGSALGACFGLIIVMPFLQTMYFVLYRFKSRMINDHYKPNQPARMTNEALV